MSLHKGPRPWHVAFGPVFVLLVFLREGSSGATPETVVWPLVVILLLILLLWTVLSRAFGNARKSALFVTTLAVAGLGYFAISALAEFVRVPAIVPGVYVVVAALLAAIWRAGDRTTRTATIAVNVLTAAAALAVAGLIWQEQRRIDLGTSYEIPEPLSVPGGTDQHQRPDIFVVILEGYGRADVLREDLGFETDLVGSLRSLGFFVADDAAANYPQIGQALAASLNVDYLPSILRFGAYNVNLRRRFGALMTRNRLFGALHAAGYRIRSYESEYALLRPEPADARPGPLVRFTNFEYRLYEGTVLPRALEAMHLPRGILPLYVHRHHVQWTLDQLAREPVEEDGRPTFVFAHLLIPHPPFSFDAHGGARSTRMAMAFNDGSYWDELATGTGERYRSGYLDSVRFLNARIPSLVRQILGRAKRPTIFYILSDHGPASRLDWAKPTPSTVRERMGILLAVRFPDGGHSPIGARTTPINAFRVLLNRALGMDLDLLPDRSYYTTWEDLTAFVDVTDQVQ